MAASKASSSSSTRNRSAPACRAIGARAERSDHDIDASEQAASALDRLLRPRSVAIVGASAEPGSIGGCRARQSGALRLPRRDPSGQPQGQARSTAAIVTARSTSCRIGIDAAVLVVPQQGVIEAVAACGRRRIGGAVVFASGFAEIGEAGRGGAGSAGAHGARAGVRLLGPNCIGFTNFADGVALTFETIAPEPVAGRPAVGVVTQSGALAGALARSRSPPKVSASSYAVSTGNEADLAAEDFLAFLLDDRRHARHCAVRRADPAAANVPVARRARAVARKADRPAASGQEHRAPAHPPPRIPARWQATMP